MGYVICACTYNEPFLTFLYSKMQAVAKGCEEPARQAGQAVQEGQTETEE